MYTEFIIGYILMGVLAVMLAVVIVLLCIILKKLSRVGGARHPEATFGAYSKSNAYSDSRGTVVCRNCATQYDSVHTVCPKCGTPR